MSHGIPIIRTVGLTGMLVTFSDLLSEDSNRATLAFKAAVDSVSWAGVQETATSLASVYLRFDPQELSHDALRAQLQALLEERDWYAADLPSGRRFWRVPTVYGTDLAPQLSEAADLAGLSEVAAIESFANSRVRALTIGFAPGQPYLGPLGEEWNLPRQSDLTPMVPAGALLVAISQFVLFSSPNPTGWRHVGQTGFTLFRQDSDEPFSLRAGDELQFEPVTLAELTRLIEKDPDFGGAVAAEITS